jgi:predicted HTH domain antitoxin
MAPPSAKIEAGNFSLGEFTMNLVISDDLVNASGFSKNELLLEIALMLFQQDKISLGKASELLELHRMQFQKLMAERGIYVHYDIEEFQEDLKTL